MIPDGDRRHDPKSGRAVNQPGLARIRYENIVAELVLGDHSRGRKRRVVSDHPLERVLDRALAFNSV